MHFDTHVCFYYNLYILKNAKIIVKKNIKHMKKIVKSHKKMTKMTKVQENYTKVWRNR